ncbi:MAG: IS110 family transposase [Phenylobacterium sp.]|nr:MAG: IS110 family transposase [Phenylobacterium sp.]
MHWPPLRLVRLRFERESVGVVCPPASPVLLLSELKEAVVRAVGLDVHLDFCEVAIVEDGEVRSAGRIETKPEQIELFAGSLGPDDRVALEVTGNAWEIARIIGPHVAQVLVVSPSDTGIRQARAKTDRLDSRTLAKLLAAGSLDAVWMPDRETWVMRRRLSRRGQLVWARSRAKNEIHAVLMRQLVGRPPFSDLFGVKARKWLAGLELAFEERETVDAAMRQIEFLDSEIAEVERLIARDALDSPEIKRLMGVPGVNVIVAASFMAAIGDISRFENPRKLVGYLGLDPRVRQSGPGPATHGHISKQGSVRARHALVEACWSAVRQPGPLHAFYQRIRARRGHSVAIVATARKLSCLFWCLLSREEDYAYAQPSLTKKKLRRLEITAGAERYTSAASGIWKANEAIRDAERELAHQAEVAYARTVRDWHATQAAKAGASATLGRASNRPSKGKAARQTTSP